jgi:CRISPR-associated protein Cst1
MTFHLTGNPFVDTGIGVIAALGGCRKISDLDIDIMKSVHGNGEKLARRNSLLKSMSMIFTTNSLCTNPAIKDKDKRLNYYSKITTALLDNIGNEDVDEICESCGHTKSLDLSKLMRNALVPLGYVGEQKYIGRDWFPLAGSLTSDAQALPSSSRAPNICSKCLFAVHYLTHGVLLIGGRLAVFQSTSISFWYGFIRNLTNELDNRISAGDYSNFGDRDKTTAIKRLMLFLKDLKDEEVNATLYLWKFSNSGTGADCSIEEIPNRALVFLHTIEREGLEGEVLGYLKTEKSPQYSFFNCILYQKDYLPLYPFKKFRGASLRLYYLYQTLIREVKESFLSTCYLIAEYLSKKLSEKQLESFGKDLDKDYAKQNHVKKIIIEMIQNNVIGFENFIDLLNIKKIKDRSIESLENNDTLAGSVFSFDHDTWKIIKYYLHKETDSSNFRGGDKVFFDNNWSQIPINSNESNQPAFVDTFEKINNLGEFIYKNYVSMFGKERFIRQVLSDYSRSVNSAWLRKQYIKVSVIERNFNFRTWCELFISKSGKEDLYDTLYFFRILWTIKIKHMDAEPNTTFSKLLKPSEDTSNLQTNDAYDSADQSNSHPYLLESVIYERLKQKILWYIQNKGPNYFSKYVLGDVENSASTLGWYKKILELDDDKWDIFLNNENQRGLAQIRQFQLNLLFIHISQEYLNKDLEEKKINV